MSSPGKFYHFPELQQNPQEPKAPIFFPQGPPAGDLCPLVRRVARIRDGEGGAAENQGLRIVGSVALIGVDGSRILEINDILFPDYYALPTQQFPSKPLARTRYSSNQKPLLT